MKIVKNFKSPHKYINHTGAMWTIDTSTYTKHLHRENGPAEIDTRFSLDNIWWIDGECFFRVAREKEKIITVYI